MKPALFPFIVATLLIAFSGCGQVGSSPPPPHHNASADQAVGVLSPSHGAYILVRVVETFPEPRDPPEFNSTVGRWVVSGKVLVLKSWWAPFSAGQVVYVGRPVMTVLQGNYDSYEGQTPYPLRVGDELLILVGPRTKEPIWATVASTYTAAESLAAMARLDRALELEDPTTEPHRARERERESVMQAVKKCFADASLANNDRAYVICQRIDVSVLGGVQRGELVASLGSPTWCQDINLPNERMYLHPTGADCAPVQPAIWRFHRGVNLRCLPVSLTRPGGGRNRIGRESCL
jgi:hypothetical protein